VTNEETIERIMEMADEEETKQIGLDEESDDDDDDDAEQISEMPAEFFRTQEQHSNAFFDIIKYLLNRHHMSDAETLEDKELRPIVHEAVMYTLEWEGAEIDGYIDFSAEDTEFRQLLERYSDLGEQLLDIRDEALGFDGDAPE
jgi:inorganic pyrophosphatase